MTRRNFKNKWKPIFKQLPQAEKNVNPSSRLKVRFTRKKSITYYKSMNDFVKNKKGIRYKR